jgi:hypothetical protein
VASSLQLNETGKRPITRALNRRKLDTCRPNLERKARWDLAQAKKPCTQADPHFHPSCLAPCSAQYQMADGGWCCSWDGWKAARDQPTSSALRWRRAAPGLSPLCLCLCLCPDSRFMFGPGSRLFLSREIKLKLPLLNTETARSFVSSPCLLPSFLSPSLQSCLSSLFPSPNPDLCLPLTTSSSVCEWPHSTFGVTESDKYTLHNKTVVFRSSSTRPDSIGF